MVAVRVPTGHGKPGKSWNLNISVSRPVKSQNLIVGHGKSWKIIAYVVRTDYCWCQKIPEIKDDFDNFRKWQLTFRSCKTRKRHGKSWNLKRVRTLAVSGPRYVKEMNGGRYELRPVCVRPALL